MTRQDIYKAIDSERLYQELNMDLSTSDFPLSSAMEAIRFNLEKANKSWYREKAPYIDSMEYIRKIAAICVQMGEKYGMNERIVEKIS